MANKCNKCEAAISWDGWTSGPPNNPDGTPHKCMKQKQLSSGGTSFVKTSIEQAPKFLDTALTLSDTILKRIDGVVEPKDQMENTIKIFDTLSRSYKVDE